MLIWAFHEFFRPIACRCALYGLPLPCYVKELNDDGHTRCLKKNSGDQDFRNVKESNSSGNPDIYINNKLKFNSNERRKEKEQITIS